jgi:hypothetical protein
VRAGNHLVNLSPHSRAGAFSALQPLALRVAAARMGTPVDLHVLEDDDRPGNSVPSGEPRVGPLDGLRIGWDAPRCATRYRSCRRVLWLLH